MAKRFVTASVVVGALMLPCTLPAAADITPPDGTAPVVGMAYMPGTSSLWLAGAQANDAVVVNADDGTQVTFAGEPVSVQALASHGDQLWIGDIGDENGNRETVTVFRLATLAEANTRYNSFDFRYEDGAQDAKAMAISGRGRIYVVTAGDNPGIYRAELEPSRERVNTLTRVVDAPTGVTDAVFLADGETLALRTAEGIEYLNAWTWEKQVTHTLVGAAADEAIAADDQGAIYVGGNPTIRQMARPSSDTTETVAPSPQPSPSHSASSPSEPSDQQPAPPEGTPGNTAPARSGTIVALVLAGVVALLTGGVALFVKR